MRGDETGEPLRCAGPLRVLRRRGARLHDVDEGLAVVHGSGVPELARHEHIAVVTYDALLADDTQGAGPCGEAEPGRVPPRDPH